MQNAVSLDTKFSLTGTNDIVRMVNYITSRQTYGQHEHTTVTDS